MRRIFGTLAVAVVVIPLGPVSADAGQLRTDFTKHVVPLEDILPGGPPPDGIPAVDRPVFLEPGAADA